MFLKKRAEGAFGVLHEALGGGAAVDPGAGGGGRVAQAEHLVDEGPQEGEAQREAQGGEQLAGNARADDLLLEGDDAGRRVVGRSAARLRLSWGRVVMSINSRTRVGSGSYSVGTTQRSSGCSRRHRTRCDLGVIAPTTRHTRATGLEPRCLERSPRGHGWEAVIATTAPETARWERFLPGAAVLRRYDRAWLRGDVLGGSHRGGIPRAAGAGVCPGRRAASDRGAVGGRPRAAHLRAPRLLAPALGRPRVDDGAHDRGRCGRARHRFGRPRGAGGGRRRCSPSPSAWSASSAGSRGWASSPSCSRSRCSSDTWPASRR